MSMKKINDVIRMRISRRASECRLNYRESRISRPQLPDKIIQFYWHRRDNSHSVHKLTRTVVPLGSSVLRVFKRQRAARQTYSWLLLVNRCKFKHSTMGSSSSTVHVMTQEMLEDYSQLTYLNKAEIVYIFRLFETLGPRELEENFHHRFPVERILDILPQIRYNPFRESILRVFSSKQDAHMSFEDTLDLCSALSDNCPVNVRAAWAFQIFDFDGDNQVSLDDLIEAVERVTGIDGNGQIRIDRQSAEYIAQTVLQEMDLDHTGSIGTQEFVHTVVRMPEFAHTFRLMP